MFNPEKTDYPRNEADQPEFASIILTVDGVSRDPELGDDVVQKIVLSTQDVITTLSKLSAYFNEPTLLASPQNANLLVEAGRASNPVFVYLPPREGTVQIIASTPTWDSLVQHPDFGNTSALLASEKLQEIVAHQQGLLLEYAGGFSNLLLLDLSTEKFEEQGSASSEGGAGEDAERIRDTASFEDVEHEGLGG